MLRLTDTIVDALVVDLAGVTFIDATGIGALVRIHNISLEFHKRLLLRAPTDRLRQILKITGLDAVFSVHVAAAETPVSA